MILTVSSKSNEPVSQAARMCRKRGRIVLVGVTGLELSRAEFYTTAIKHVTALDAIIFPVIEPILNPILVFFILGEALGPWAFLGGALVLGSVVFRGLLKK